MAESAKPAFDRAGCAATRSDSGRTGRRAATSGAVGGADARERRSPACRACSARVAAPDAIELEVGAGLARISDRRHARSRPLSLRNTNVSTPLCRQLAPTSRRLKGREARVSPPSPGSCQISPGSRIHSQSRCAPVIAPRWTGMSAVPSCTKLKSNGGNDFVVASTAM